MKSCTIIICFILLTFCLNVDAGCNCPKHKQYCEFQTSQCFGGIRSSADFDIIAHKNCRCIPKNLNEKPHGDIKCDPGSTKGKIFNSLC
ncbi:hypothetical protein ACQ4LE_001690 [Meloidogyne hapla]